MADRWAEVRGIEDQIAALVAEYDRGLFLPWRMRRRRQIRRELRRLLPVMEAAFAEAAEAVPRKGRKDAFGRAVSVRYEP